MIIFSEKNKYSFIETSALDASNVGEAFNNLLVGKFTCNFIKTSAVDASNVREVGW